MKRELGAVAWSAADPFKLLVASAEDEPRNQVSVVERRDGKLVTVATAEHRYQPAKVMFVPRHERIFVTASDTVYLWDESKRSVGEGGRTTLQSPYENATTFADFEQTLEPLALPPQWPTGKYCAPIVGFDIVDTGLVAAHCDGQCMVWDLNVAAAAGRKDPPLLDHTAAHRHTGGARLTGTACCSSRTRPLHRYHRQLLPPSGRGNQRVRVCGGSDLRYGSLECVVQSLARSHTRTADRWLQATD